MMHTSQHAITLIKQFSPLKLHAENDSDQQWSIGYGHTTGVKPNDVISTRQAECLLRTTLVRIEQDLQKLVKVPLTQGQFDAIVSYTFSTNTRQLSTSALLQKINQQDFIGAADELYPADTLNIYRFTRLDRRRLLERRLFKS